MGLFIYVTAMAFLTVVSAHSRLISPLYEKNGYCDGQRCHICKEPLRYEETGVNAEKPAVTWKRGQKVRYSYQKNNHREGIVRLSIIPMDYRNDEDAHERYAFTRHCYAGPGEKCPASEKKNGLCVGLDRERLFHYHDIVIPTVIPDGVYHFSFTWYGGGDHIRRQSFPNYYSCSVIRIEGGEPLQGTWTVNFDALDGSGNKRESCASHVRNTKQCERGVIAQSGPRKGQPTGFYCQNVPEIQVVPDPAYSFITSEMYAKETLADDV